MSFLAILTSDTITETWSGSNNKSDSWSSVEADGGSITRKLGTITTPSQNTVTYTSGGAAQTIHMVTDTGAPEAINILATSSFGINDIHAWESAGQLNGTVYIKISIVTESGGVLSYDRTLVDWVELKQGSTAREVGQNVGSSSPMGGVSSVGITNYPQITGATTLAVDERLAIEVGFNTAGRNGDTLNIEYGDTPNDHTSSTLAVDSSGTGPYGSAIVVPITFSEAYQDRWGEHSEINVPVVSGTDTIAWADVGSDWTVAKWQTTGASRYVTRQNGAPTGQMWIFQDDDYLYVAVNNIIDGCIQNSDHHELFLCPTGDWKNAVETDNEDWAFRRDITNGTSATRTPTLPVGVGDGDDQGEYILQGDPAATYPENWEIPSYDTPTKVFTFTSNSYTWTEGTDFRMGGPGATATAPAPTGASIGGAYSEFKISKAKLNNWNGTDHMGFICLMQCDVQADGFSSFPSSLGSRSDKNDWPWTGIYYSTADGKNASTKTPDKDELDLRPLMAAHAHAPEVGNTYNPTETITGVTTTTAADLNIGHRPTETVTGITTTTDADLTMDYHPTVIVTGITTTTDADLNIGYRPTETITGVTTTTDADIDVGMIYNPTETITGVTTTTDADLNIGHRPTETVTGVTTTTDADLTMGYRPTVTVTGVTSTQDAIVNIGHRPTETVTGVTTTTDADLNIGYRPTETITGTTTTQDADITVGTIFNPTETITGITSTQDVDLNIGYRPTETITGVTSTQDADLTKIFNPTETITGVTSTQDAIVNIGHRPTETITGTTTTQDADISLGAIINPTETITGATTTTDAVLNIGHRPTETITGVTTTTDADLNIGHRPTETVTGTTTTTDADLNMGYRPVETVTGVTTTTDADITVGAIINPTETVTGTTTTTDADLNIGHRPAETITGTTTTTDADIVVGHFPTVTVTSITTTQSATVNIGHRVGTVITSNTSTQDGQLDIGYRPAETVTGTTTTSSADIDVTAGGVVYNPTETITGVTTTQDSQLDIGYRPTETITGTTTTQDGQLDIDRRPTETITGSTTTSDADITITGAQIYNPTAIFPAYSRVRFANLIILVEQGTGVGGVPIIAGGGYRDTHAEALRRRKLPKVIVKSVEVLDESRDININISVLKVTDLLVEDLQ